LGDVGKKSRDADDVARGIADRELGGTQVLDAGRHIGCRTLGFDDIAVLQHPPIALSIGARDVRRRQVEIGKAVELANAPPEPLLIPTVHQSVTAVAVLDEDGKGRVVHDGAQLALGLLQGEIGEFPLRVVGDDAADGDDGAGTVANRKLRHRRVLVVRALGERRGVEADDCAGPNHRLVAAFRQLDPGVAEQSSGRLAARLVPQPPGPFLQLAVHAQVAPAAILEEYRHRRVVQDRRQFGLPLPHDALRRLAAFQLPHHDDGEAAEEQRAQQPDRTLQSKVAVPLRECVRRGDAHIGADAQRRDLTIGEDPVDAIDGAHRLERTARGRRVHLGKGRISRDRPADEPARRIAGQNHSVQPNESDDAVAAELQRAEEILEGAEPQRRHDDAGEAAVAARYPAAHRDDPFAREPSFDRCPDERPGVPLVALRDEIVAVCDGRGRRRIETRIPDHPAFSVDDHQRAHARMSTGDVLHEVDRLAVGPELAVAPLQRGRGRSERIAHGIENGLRLLIESKRQPLAHLPRIGDLCLIREPEVSGEAQCERDDRDAAKGGETEPAQAFSGGACASPFGFPPRLEVRPAATLHQPRASVGSAEG
jgi:hypothetical protein